jgi:small subunit ribosomal protein S14
VAKKSKIAQTKRIAKLVAQYRDQRAELVALIKNPETSPEDRAEAYRKIRKMPRDASASRYRNRCDVTGRPRAYMRKFRMSRISFRDLALEGKLPGVTKSSW